MPSLHERLLRAAYLNDSVSAKSLLSRGASQSHVDALGNSALFWASWRGNLDVLNILLEHGGGDIEQISRESGNTPLTAAAYAGHVEVVKRLVQAGARVDKPDEEGDTALMQAAWNGHVEVVKVLLNAGAKMGKKGKRGKGAVWYAGKAGKREVVKLMIEWRKREFKI